jgi:hypothetical protein
MRRIWASIAFGTLPLFGCARGNAVAPPPPASSTVDRPTPLPPLDGSTPPCPVPQQDLPWWKAMFNGMRERDEINASRMPPRQEPAIGDS